MQWPTARDNLQDGAALYFSHGFSVTYSKITGVVPPENVFERNQGHFTVPISMVRNARAFRRLADILHRL